MSTGGDIEPPHVDLAIVHHAPYIGTWESDYLIAHIIIIAVQSQRQIVVPTAGPSGKGQPETVLMSQLRTEPDVAETAVVEIVERGHAEHILPHSSEEQLTSGSNRQLRESMGSEPMLVGRASPPEWLLQLHSEGKAANCLQTGCLPAKGKCRYRRPARGLWHRFHVDIDIVAQYVITQISQCQTESAPRLKA